MAGGQVNAEKLDFEYRKDILQIQKTAELDRLEGVRTFFALAVSLAPVTRTPSTGRGTNGLSESKGAGGRWEGGCVEWGMEGAGGGSVGRGVWMGGAQEGGSWEISGERRVWREAREAGRVWWCMG